MSRRRRVAVVPLVTLSVLATGCGDDDARSGVATADATATLVTTDAGARVAEVSLTLRSASDDEIQGASVDPAFAGKVTLASYSSASGGDGHLGHLDPETEGTHTHGGKLSIDLPTDREVKVGPGGVAQVRVRDLVAEPKPGDTFRLTLDFEKAPDADIEVTVDEV